MVFWPVTACSHMSCSRRFERTVRLDPNVLNCGAVCCKKPFCGTYQLYLRRIYHIGAHTLPLYSSQSLRIEIYLMELIQVLLQFCLNAPQSETFSSALWIISTGLIVPHGVGLKNTTWKRLSRQKKCIRFYASLRKSFFLKKIPTQCSFFHPVLRCDCLFVRRRVCYNSQFFNV